MKALVTGATGFIGGQLARALAARGDAVRILARPAAGRQHPAGYEVVVGEVTDPRAARAAVRDIEVVFHVAAIRDRWGIPYADYYRVNVEGTRVLLAAAAEAGCRFVYCSSVGVLGHPGCQGIDESFPYAAGDGKYNYSHTKALADEMTLASAAAGRLQATVIRPVITYGPGDSWGMVTRLISMLDQRCFLPVGDGRNLLHLAYISDLVQAFLRAAESPQAHGRAYIVAGPAPITLGALVEKICGLLGVAPPRWHVPLGLARAAGRGMELLYTLKQRAGISAGGQTPFITRDKVDTLTISGSYNTARAERDLGFRPAVDYDEGLRLTLAWLRGQQ